jgi:GH15 family glucan-1,4-alpha-glucosidase
VADSGKMDGGLFGYNLEWVRDASMAAGGAVLAGHTDVSSRMLERILTRMISENGAALDSSFHRPPETIELDQNGQLLSTLWTHWAWTGSDTLIRNHWPRIRATADFALDPVYRDARTGLVKNTREFWERSMGHGLREGYELTYQCWNIVGWRRAAEMAEVVGDSASAARWLDAADRMRKSLLGDATHSFIRDGRLVKRLLADGAPQWTMEPPRREALPPGMPLRVEPVSYCNPDAASVYPMLLGVVDAEGDVARRTLESMEPLWNQRWDIGGYGRYHVTGEPDSPGPWPFASLFIARAYLEAGDSAKALRVLRWLQSVPGGRSGAWFEYYGTRPVPPLPPVAVIPWTWAEIVTLFVHHVLGVRPDPKGVTVMPRLLDGMKDVRAVLRLNGRALSLRIRRGMGREAAFVDGAEIQRRSGAARLARPERDMAVEIWL